MARQKPTPEAVEAEVAALGDLDLAAVREKWRLLFGSPPPKSLRHAFLVKACAYEIRTKAFGGLSAATKRRLRDIAEATRVGNPTPAAPVRTKAGTRLIRAWGGATHVVTVVAGGFEHAGKTHRSLSAIARLITGTNWNGKTFFGVKKPPAARAVAKDTETTSGLSAAQAAPRGRPTPSGVETPDNQISQRASQGAHAVGTQADMRLFPIVSPLSPEVSAAIVELEAKGHE